MRKFITLSVLSIAVLLFGCTDTQVSKPTTVNVESSGCKIENPDPDGYLLKICKYLTDHKDDIDTAPADISKYKIKSIKDGEYSRYEGDKEIITEAIVVNLDCCYRGDVAYFDKKTKEIIGFHVGDL